MVLTLEESTSLQNYWPPISNKIAVCMSGGVDSSVSAYLLAKRDMKQSDLQAGFLKDQIVAVMAEWSMLQRSQSL